MLQAGQITTLKVLRKSAFGYFLTDGEAEILLHNNEADAPLKEDENVEVFLYMDHQERIAATMHRPIIVLGEFGWLRVTDVNKKMGVFLDMGIHKELLLSKDDLPYSWADWPQPEDKVFVGLKHDRKGRLLAKLGIDVELKDQEKKADKKIINTEVSGHVYRVIPAGAFLFTEEGYIGFIHRDDMKEPIRLGEWVSARVKSIREDGRINVTHQPSKKVAYNEDSEMILDILKQRGGAMPIWDKSDPELIRNKFHISKAAFKRAIGKLMKEDLVYQEEGWTYLTTLRDRK